MHHPRGHFAPDDPRAMGYFETTLPASKEREDEPLAPTGDLQTPVLQSRSVEQYAAKTTLLIETTLPPAKLDYIVQFLRAWDPDATISLAKATRGD